MTTTREIAAIRIFVTDLEGALSFYRDLLGFFLAARGPSFLLFRAGIDFIVEETSPDDASIDPSSEKFLGISFKTQDIAQDVLHLKSRGVRFHGEPALQEWGGWLAHFDDPFGHTLTLAQYPEI